MTREALIEALASAEHASWARWMRYLFEKCAPDGSLTLSAEYVVNLRKQIDTAYADLSEYVKQYDRDEVAHILPIIEQYAAEPKMNSFNVQHGGISGKTLINGEEQSDE